MTRLINLIYMKEKRFKFLKRTLMAVLVGGLAVVPAAAQYSIKVPPVTPDTVKVDGVAMQREVRKVHDYAYDFDAFRKRRTLYLNKDITTFIVNGDNIKMMDISLPGNVIAGNQPGENIARIKPIKQLRDGEDMGVVTIVGERTLTQFTLVYTEDPTRATSQYKCADDDAISYLNPSVDMTRSQMYEYAWHIMNTPNRFYDVSNRANKLKISLNNIYTTGNYFFIDVSVKNTSRIQFDIEEIRIKVCDKRKMKATNNQEIEIIPTMMLNESRKFIKEYRNVFVLPKMTFPDEKVLNITIAEKQISGRTITLSIDYADVLNADSYNSVLMN